jgi:hypothetical protein
LGKTSLREALMAKQRMRAQQDLFEELPGMRLGATDRVKAVEQLQALLMEAMAGVGDGLEAGDDQDHA